MQALTSAVGEAFGGRTIEKRWYDYVTPAEEDEQAIEEQAAEIIGNMKRKFRDGRF